MLEPGGHGLGAVAEFLEENPGATQERGESFGVAEHAQAPAKDEAVEAFENGFDMRLIFPHKSVHGRPPETLRFGHLIRFRE